MLLAIPARAADLRSTSDPKQIAKAFPAKSQARVVNIWATWCAPCVAELPDLRAVDDAFGDEVSIVGVSLDDMIPDTKPANVSAFLDKQKVRWPNFYFTGQLDPLADHYKFDGSIPITIVFDANNREVWRSNGQIKKDETIARLREILRRKR
ncbi:MAG TPA: TlpA disulfide reductase family protein [Thermoanaerobaculia bacterium]|nr:TlpA disulfide reductase family protein [Thermoanaerobaculia bacterium]